MGNNSATVVREPKFWRIVSVISLLIAAVAIVLSASFAQDIKAQQVRADLATQQQLAGVTGERDQARAKTDELSAQVAALTTERDGLKTKAAELADKLAAAGVESLKAKLDDATRDLAAATKERDELRAKVEDLTGAGKPGDQRGEKKPGHHEPR